MIRIYLGDAIEVLEKLQVKVDMVLTDLPFGTTNAKWDKALPMSKVWEALERVTNPSTPIVLFGAEPFSSMVRLSNIKSYKYDWTWIKTTPTSHQNAKRQPLRSVENIMVFYKKQCSYYPIKTYGHKRKVSTRKKGDTSELYSSNVSVTTYDSTERYPTNTLFFKKDSSKYHSTQKPIALLEYLIKTYTKEGDVVLDITMGSGSTMVACIETNRKGIGIELVDKYYQIAKKRIEEASRTPKLFY